MLGQPMQLNSPLNMLTRMQGIQNMRQTNALNAMQMQQAQARQQALAQLPPPPPDAPPEWHQMHRAVVTGLASPKDYFEMVTKPKPDRKLTVVGKTAIDPRTGQPVYTEPAAPEKINPNQPFMIQDGKVVPNQVYQDYEVRKAAASAARIDARGSKPSPGYRWTADGQGQEAIPGGPADNKARGVLNADTQAMTGATGAMDRLAAAANDALNAPGLAGVFGLRGAIPNIPGSDAADAAAQLNTLKSQVAFSVLQEMRNNSKTGGALGAVSDKEMALLQANLATLDKAQSVEQAQKSLRAIVQYTEAAKDRMRQAYNLKHGDKATPATETPAGSAFSDADKERRYQEWKARQQ